jgi:hypothetical protein
MKNPQEILERSIYEALRLKAVADGLTPDITAFQNTAVGFEAYKLALKQIQTSKGFALEIFGNSSISAKGQIRTPRIVMEWGGYTPNDIGSSPGVFFEPIPTPGTGFNKMVTNVSSDIGLLDIILVSENTEQERYLQSLIRRALPSMSYIPIINQAPPYTASSDSFLIVQNSVIKTSSFSDSTKEWIYSFSIPDIWWDVSSVLTTTSKIQDITINQLIIDHLGISSLF